MATSYPGGLDAFTNPTATDSLASATVPHATQHANANDAIEAIQAELGTDPAGASATVKARFDVIEAAGWVTSTRILDGTIVNGDISGSAAIDPAKINGTAVVTSDSRLSDARTPTAHASTHASAGSDPITIAQSQVTDLTSDLAGKVATADLRGYTQNDAAAIDTIPRWAAATAVAPVSGSIQFMQFTAPWSITIDTIAMSCTATTASGLTLARFGLYTVSGDDYTLVAQTASDTSLFNSANTVFERTLDTTGGFPATYDLVAGSRYAVAVVLVGTTMPTIVSGPVTGLGGVYSAPPRMTTAVSGKTDLTPSETGLTNVSTRNYWARLS